MNDRAQKMTRLKWEAAAFHGLLFAYPLLGFFWRRLYPLTAPETLVLLAAAILAGFLVALVLAPARSAIRNLCSALLTVAVLTLQFDLLMEALIPVMVLLAIVAIRLGDRFQRYALPVLAVMILGSWLDGRSDNEPWRPTAQDWPVRSELPPIVHVVFDGFIGPAGLPPGPDAEVIRQDMTALFTRYGFQVHERAYSRHATTGDSMYAALNFSDAGDSEYLEEVNFRRAHGIKTSAYFERLQRLGYVFNVYQTEFFDYCRSLESSLESCWTYPQPNVLTIVHAGPVLLRSRMLLSVLLAQSSLFRDLMPGVANPMAFGIPVHDPRVFKYLRRDLAEGPEGRVFFAHALLPHGPFAFAPDCSVDYTGRGWERTSGVRGEPVLPEAAYERRYLFYFRQLQCALGSLHGLLEEMRSSGSLDEALILVHGDHGSLIGRHPPSVGNLRRLEPRDYRAHFSTLFAWKPPLGRFTTSSDTLPLNALLEDFVTQVETRVTGAGQSPVVRSERDPAPYVYLSGAHPRHRVDIDIFEGLQSDRR